MNHKPKIHAMRSKAASHSQNCGGSALFYPGLPKHPPIIHVISNKVTLSDVVNVILASGGNAVCGDCIDEAAEITSLSDALLLNMGTPDSSTSEKMLKSSKAANHKNIPIVFDPVGIGISDFRKNIALKIINETRISCIRGNHSEISALYNIIKSRGSILKHSHTIDSGGSIPSSYVSELAALLSVTVIATGSEDIVSDGSSSRVITGGSDMLTKITGSGCMLDGLLALSLASANIYGKPVTDTVTNTLQYYKNAAQKAAISSGGGTASFKQKFIDILSSFSYTEYL